MAKSKKGSGSLVKKIIGIALFVFLAANFCVNGKPLWKNIFSGSEIPKIDSQELKKKAEKLGKDVKEAAGDAKKGTEKAAGEAKKKAEEAADEIKKGAEEVKKGAEEVKKGAEDLKKGASGITDEDEAALEKIIEKNTKK